MKVVDRETGEKQRWGDEGILVLSLKNKSEAPWVARRSPQRVVYI